ncbi:MAG: hypothetical protein EPO08_10990 [Rhodospirillaceae bacterium]|nr:MAG: hypothetical protein EPO08_10990 [Rhodospirillaceae bacterium]
MTDRRALNQILINLVNNSIKFTDKGRIGIELVHRRSNGRAQTQIVVSDTGVGISDEGQSQLFQAFTQVGPASERAQGTGLGLHLSQKLANLIGGKITLESKVGKGSTFTLTIDEV